MCFSLSTVITSWEISLIYIICISNIIYKGEFTYDIWTAPCIFAWGKHGTWLQENHNEERRGRKTHLRSADIFNDVINFTIGQVVNQGFTPFYIN